jgi:F420-non-reducing hydrogenase iron-sulfur subunit
MSGPAGAGKPSAGGGPKKTSAEKAAVKKTAAKKTATKKTAAKGAAGKTAVKKTAAKKETARNGTGGKRPAKRAPAASGQGPRPFPGGDPRIVVFACNWCSYAGADTAGVSRIQHQPHFRIIRVMCSGRVQPSFVLRAFEKGADGVLVSGCHFGDCHYISGNEHAVEQYEITRRLIQLLGLEEERLRLEWISAAEGPRFAQVINEFTDQVRALGRSPLAGVGAG